jgi:hypothetical protein
MSPAAGGGFILNGYDGVRYTLMRYADGVAVPTTPIVGPQNNGGATHIAWPSAFQIGNTTRVYGSRHYANQWRDIAVWNAQGGQPFTWGGVVLSQWPIEPYGIGPSQVYYDGEAALPWKLIYLVRNSTGSGNRFDLADSADGVAWTRRGAILTASEPYEAAGISPSHVVRANDGTWVLFYQAYQTTTFGPAVIATAPTSSGPFTNKQVIFWPNGIAHAVTGAKRLTITGTVNGPVRIGEPHIIRRMAGGGMQVCLPIKQVGSTVYFDEFLLAEYDSNVQLAHIARNKVDPSYAYQCPDGSWRGVCTGYGHWPDQMTEYTFSVQAPALSGPWTIAPGRVPFSPWNLATLLSAENPTPIVQVA